MSRYCTIRMLTLAAALQCATLGGTEPPAVPAGGTPPAAASAGASVKTPSTVTLMDAVPPDDGFDWIQLKTGEWLKGRIKAMQERELEFTSEELDDQTFDWSKIRQLRSAHAMDILLVDEDRMTGRIIMTPEQIVVDAIPPRTVSREQIQSLTKTGDRERDYWSGTISVGVTLRTGNTEQADFNTTVELQRRTPLTRAFVNYTANYSGSRNSETANNQRLTAEFDRWITERIYLIVPAGEFYRDPFQNIDSRLTGNLGVGYDIIARSKLEWSVTLGPAYQYIWYTSSQVGSPSEVGTGAIVSGMHFEWDVTKSVEFSLDYSGQLTSPEAGQSTHHLELGLSADIGKFVDLDVTFTWDRIDNPKPDSNGVEPKPDDFRLLFGFGVDF